MSGPDRPFMAGYSGEDLHPSRTGRLAGIAYRVGRVLGGINGLEREQRLRDAENLAMLDGAIENSTGINRQVMTIIKMVGEVPGDDAGLRQVSSPSVAMSEEDWGDNAGITWSTSIVGPTQPDGERQLLEMSGLPQTFKDLEASSVMLTARRRVVNGELQYVSSKVTIKSPDPTDYLEKLRPYTREVIFTIGDDGELTEAVRVLNGRYGYPRERFSEDNAAAQVHLGTFLDRLQTDILATTAEFQVPDPREFLDNQ